MRNRFISLLCTATVLGFGAPNSAALSQTTFQPSPTPMHATRAGMPGTAVNVTPVSLPACKYAQQSVAVDLSTTSAMGIDPHWALTSTPPPSGGTGPGSVFGGPSHAIYAGWTGVPANWIEPFPAPLGPPNPVGMPLGAPVGNYTYKLTFTLSCAPQSYSRLDLSGVIAADNDFTATLNNMPLASCSGGYCFQSPGTTIAAPPISAFVQGTNTIIIVVKNAGQYTGLSVQAVLRAMCGRMCCQMLPSKGTK